MPSDSALGVDEVFLGSCKEVSKMPSLRSPVAPTTTLIFLFTTAYKFTKRSLDKDKKAVVSDTECLSAFYANAAYDFYGTPKVLAIIIAIGTHTSTHHSQRSVQVQVRL
jgi:hypothetical protein